MKYLKKIKTARYPAGLEWWLLRKIPLILIVGTCIPVLLNLSIRMGLYSHANLHHAQQVAYADLMSVAIVLTFWMAVFTVTLGCLVVIVMKGPAYTADAYPVEDYDRPGP